MIFERKNSRFLKMIIKRERFASLSLFVSPALRLYLQNEAVLLLTNYRVLHSVESACGMLHSSQMHEFEHPLHCYHLRYHR
ncbi:Uncharacterised protein [Shewanella morhuae]|uniref:Uncharacterized protein n=1 Tax=Shewanella morhuae TaxID=365591 RepID=A0A379ZJR1_9GAMM|nr:Uncharacterised protein [Shewanella morhuae]